MHSPHNILTEKNVKYGTRDDPVQMKYSSVNAIFNIKKDITAKIPSNAIKLFDMLSTTCRWDVS